MMLNMPLCSSHKPDSAQNGTAMVGGELPSCHPLDLFLFYAA